MFTMADLNAGEQKGAFQESKGPPERIAARSGLAPERRIFGSLEG